MRENIRKIFKYISLASLITGVTIWIWYIIYILILKNIPYGEILTTMPIGILGIISGIISKNKVLTILNIIQTLIFPVTFAIAMSA